jgi:N-acetylmuramic acid 6-phosphate etherase
MAGDTDRDRLLTEQRNPASEALDQLSLEAAVELMQREDVKVHAALYAARADIVRAIVLIAERLARGGRLFYAGAGTSGRLAVLDAVECPPTFRTDPALVQGVIAGGPPALVAAIEGAEDDPLLAWRELEERGIAGKDVVFAIAASGSTPFAHGAIDCARAHDAGSVFLACVPFEQAPDRAEVSVRVVTGPELLTGSTRLKAGTATKLVLNTVSTLVMVRLGRVYGNLMVDVNTAGNAKLEERGARIVAALTGLDREASLALLERAGGEVKLAVVMQRLKLDAQRARAKLESCRGFLRAALER